MKVSLLIVVASLLFTTCQQQVGEHKKYEARSSISVPSIPHVLQLNPYNFHEVEDTFRMSNKSSHLVKKGWVIVFQSHLCKHCVRMQKHWEAFVDMNYQHINFGQVNCAIEEKNNSTDEEEYTKSHNDDEKEDADKFKKTMGLVDQQDEKYKRDLEDLCHVRHKISHYPSYILYPALDQPDFDQEGATLNFYEFHFQLRPEKSHFRVLRQFAIESQEGHQNWEMMVELPFKEKFWMFVDTYFFVYTHRIYKYSDKVNGEESSLGKNQTGILKLLTNEGFLFQQQQAINAINRLSDQIGFPVAHWIQPYLIIAMLTGYAIFFARKFSEVFHLTHMQVKIDQKATEILKKQELERQAKLAKKNQGKKEKKE